MNKCPGVASLQVFFPFRNETPVLSLKVAMKEIDSCKLKN